MLSQPNIKKQERTQADCHHRDSRERELLLLNQFTPCSPGQVPGVAWTNLELAADSCQRSNSVNKHKHAWCCVHKPNYCLDAIPKRRDLSGHSGRARPYRTGQYAGGMPSNCVYSILLFQSVPYLSVSHRNAEHPLTRAKEHFPLYITCPRKHADPPATPHNDYHRAPVGTGSVPAVCSARPLHRQLTVPERLRSFAIVDA